MKVTPFLALSAVSVFALSSASAFANEVQSNATSSTKTPVVAIDADTMAKANTSELIEALPESGSVIFTGMVDSVDKEDKTFILSDPSGETIDVHTTAAVTVNKGDQVKVEGQMKDEAMGIGREIAASHVKVVGKGPVGQGGAY